MQLGQDVDDFLVRRLELDEVELLVGSFVWILEKIEISLGDIPK